MPRILVSRAVFKFSLKKINLLSKLCALIYREKYYFVLQNLKIHIFLIFILSEIMIHHANCALVVHPWARYSSVLGCVSPTFSWHSWWNQEKSTSEYFRLKDTGQYSSGVGTTWDVWGPVVERPTFCICYFYISALEISAYRCSVLTPNP